MVLKMWLQETGNKNKLDGQQKEVKKLNNNRESYNIEIEIEIKKIRQKFEQNKLL